MRIKALILVFVMIITMIVPAQANETLLQEDSLITDEFFGKYVVSVKSSEVWKEVGSLNFGKHQTKQTIDITNYLTHENENVIVQLAQNGGGSAYLDAVLLGEKAPLQTDHGEKDLNKLSKEDFDITSVGKEGIILEYCASKSGLLTVVGRIEPEVIGLEPLQFPAENNYKSKDEVKDFYSYKLGNNIGSVKANGELDEIKEMEPFVKEYRVPGSGHPSGDIYFWVMNDSDNLYITMDVTPDNTFDGDKDYAKVYVDTGEGIKEFKITVSEITWGNTGFTYTDKVGYEHKVYEFVIPLNEIDVHSELEIAFVVYGTVAMPTEYFAPDLAYDANSDVYVCVYEGDNYNGRYIWADIINSDGNVLNNYPIMMDWTDNESFSPSIAYDFLNDSFMVVWCEGYSNTKIYGKIFELKEFDYEDNNDKDLYIDHLTGRFRISENEDIDGTEYIYYDEFEPEVVFNRNYEDGLYNGHFLVVWSQRANDNPATLSRSQDDIYGRFISSDGIPIGENGFVICNESGRQVEPSICYSFGNEVFLVTWLSEHADMDAINAIIINENGTLGPSIESIDGNVINPSISVNEGNDLFFLTWIDKNDNNQVKGAYLFYNGSSIVLTDDEANGIFDITTNEFDSEYPISVYGKDNMLCLWNSLHDFSEEDESYNGYAYLRYIDNYEPFGLVFKPNDPQLTEINQMDKSIDIASNYLNETQGNESFLIAYVNGGRQDISYRVVGEPAEFQPYIEFDRYEYNINLDNSNSVQSNVLYYIENDLSNIITNSEYLHFISNDESVATISETGLITGIGSGTTTIEALYYEPLYRFSSMSLWDGDELPYGTLMTKATVTVTKTELKEPSLTIAPDTIEKYVGENFTVKIDFFDGFNTSDVTDNVVISIDDATIAVTDSAIRGKIICKAVGTTTLRTTHAGIEATAVLKVIEKPTVPTSSPKPRTPIGEILVNNKVIKTLYKEDIKVKDDTYTFIADKEGDTAKLWLNSSFYKDLARDYPDRIINFVWDKGIYTLPLSCEEVLNEIGSTAKKVSVSIEKVLNEEVINSAKDSAINIGGEVVSDLIEFLVFVEKTKGNTDINSLDFYATRTINKLDITNKNVSTAMKFVEDKEILTFAPSVFYSNLATIKYRGNGIFTIIENPQTFDDISSHWAKINIESLATRNIAFGRKDKQFAPDDYITRAEFAVMITRALGITEKEGSKIFSDVQNEWFAEDINTAYESGLINGRNDGKFYPNEKIMRRDMAVMINNALKFADKETKIPDIEQELSIFNDKRIIADYAKESTAICVNAGIIMGRETKDFDPDNNATRAEASAIIERMLKYLGFMD